MKLFLLGFAVIFSLQTLAQASGRTRLSPNVQQCGAVKWFSANKYFGFITALQDEDVFFKGNDVVHTSYELEQHLPVDMKEGEFVVFNITRITHIKGWVAKNIQRVNSLPATCFDKN